MLRRTMELYHQLHAKQRVLQRTSAQRTSSKGLTMLAPVCRTFSSNSGNTWIALLGLEDWHWQLH